MPSTADHGQVGPATAARYLDLLLDRRRAEAMALIHRLVDEDDVDVRDAYLEVLEPAQRRVGDLWESDQISVAQEHYCTASTQQVIAELYPRVFATEPDGRRAVVACVGGELHELGARMIADFLQMDGWDTTYLSANVPPPDIAAEVAATNAHLLCCSVTLQDHVPVVEHVVRLVHEMRPELPILVGGLAFNRAPDLWLEVGATATAVDAQTAVAAANELVPNA